MRPIQLSLDQRFHFAEVLNEHIPITPNTRKEQQVGAQYEMVKQIAPLLSRELEGVFSKADEESISGDNASDRLKSLDKILEKHLTSKQRELLKNPASLCKEVIDSLVTQGTNETATQSPDEMRSILQTHITPQTISAPISSYIGGLHNAMKTYIGLARLAYD